MKRVHRTSLRFLFASFKRLFRLMVWCALGALLSSCSTYNPRQDFQAELLQAIDSGIIIHDVPGLEGRNRKDGIAVLQPFLAYWNRIPLSRLEYESLSEATELYPVEELMQNALEGRDLWSFAFYGSIPQLEERLEAGQPLLVMVQDNPMKIKSRRYMILIGFNRAQEKFIVEEGGAFPGVYPYGRFKKMWRPVKNWVMEVCPPEKVTWPLRMMEHVAIARYNERKGRWSDALQSYERALQQDPDNVNLFLARADALYNSGEILEAIAQYRHVLSRDELNARAANNLAHTLADTNGDIIQAEKLIRRALTIEPSNPIYMDTLGYVLLKAGRSREAADVLARARYRFELMSIQDQRTIMTRLITAYIESNQPHLARQVLNDHVKTDPEFILQEHILQQIP